MHGEKKTPNMIQRCTLRVLPPSRQEAIGGLQQGLGTPSQLAARMEICYV